MTTINSICSVIEFSGENTMTFLNNLLISDLNILEKNTYHYTALCNLKGRIIASMWINIIDSQLVKIICPKNISQQLQSFFTMRVFRLKVNIQMIEDTVTIHFDKQNIKTIEAIGAIDTNSHKEFYNFLFKKNLPWIDIHNTEKFIPQHVNLDQHHNIMSFTKGCYPGQEIIARIKFLGKIKKRMVLLKNSNKSKLNDELNDLETVSPIIKPDNNIHYYVQAIKKNAPN